MDAAILQSVRKIIVHGNCPDGRASALILHEALPDAEVIEVSYGTAQHRDLPAETGLLFCDMTPPRERVGEFVAAGTIVLDHHKGAEDIVRAFGERGVFADEARDPGVSGALVAYEQVWGPIFNIASEADQHEHQIFNLATLVGIRDTWQRDHERWDEACALAAWLAFCPLNRLLNQDAEHALGLGREVGSLLVEKRREAALAATNSAVRMVLNGRRVAIVPGTDLVSDVADAIGDGADIVAGFAFEHEPVRLQWSMRSRGEVDVAAIAKHFGGGGHTRAAGCSLLVSAAGGADPYLWARDMFGEVAV